MASITPSQWVRDGMLEVTIFVPYGYDVLPASVTSYARSSEPARLTNYFARLT